VNILSTLPAMGFGYLSGTSMSTPYVSGAALLVLSTCVLDTAHLKSLLLTNVDVLPQLNLKVSTSGRLNLYNAYSSCRQGLLMIGPDTWHFPIVFPGDPPPHTGFTFTNTGGFPIRFLSKSFQSGSAFSIIGDTCGSLLAVSSSCVVTVQFNPALALPGTNVGTLTITDTLGTSPQTVTVTGSVSCTGSSCP
jgi:subtilisin family serine protease